ncbi:hypothetical protein CPC08DRAFT_317812 [Agrocybe pediades]|nr:hypothetical protein CPC08DRAFT_317812 [Agrocybe pediades]
MSLLELGRRRWRRLLSMRVLHSRLRYEMAQRVVAEKVSVSNVSYALINVHYIHVDMRYLNIDSLTLPWLREAIYVIFIIFLFNLSKCTWARTMFQPYGVIGPQLKDIIQEFQCMARLLPKLCLPAARLLPKALVGI